MRVKMGRKAPFRLTRVEVGNEERAMEGYASHYQLITSKLWQRYPDLTIVASGRWGPSIKGSPCLSGQRCDVWDDHYYRHPDVMAGMGAVYDDYNRSLPKVFVGEFAAKSLSTKEGSNTGVRTLRAALAEGIFMIGFERNADVVVASSFAPLCNNMKGTQWSYNLINFNASNLFVLPSYHAQVLCRAISGPTRCRRSCRRTRLLQATRTHWSRRMRRRRRRGGRRRHRSVLPVLSSSRW